MVGRRIVVDQAGIAELVDRRLVARPKRVLEPRDDLDVAISFSHLLASSCLVRRCRMFGIVWLLSAVFHACSLGIQGAGGGAVLRANQVEDAESDQRER